MRILAIDTATQLCGVAVLDSETGQFVRKRQVVTTHSEMLLSLVADCLDELKLQPNGGRGLTLIDLDAKDALVSVAAFAQALQVMGKALRGDKPREEVLKGASLAAYAGKRARKGKAVEGMKAQRVLPVA